MEDKLIELLSTICSVVIQQGSLAPDEAYPDEFFTFWNYSSDSDSYYDDEGNSLIFDYTVCFYSKDVENAYSKLRRAIKLLRENDFIISGDGHAVASDDNDYIGRGVDVTIRINEKEIDDE